MSTIVTRYGKGSPLTWLEVDNNFTNLNTDKIQSGDTVAALTITSATINGGTINGTTIGASTASSGVFTSLSDSGNLTFTSTGNRILGDFTNATVANRVMFQTTTSNSATSINAIPSGTQTASNIRAVNASDPTNAAFTSLSITSSACSLTAGIYGTGTYLPLTFSVNNSERMRIDTSGNVLVNISTARANFFNSTSSPIVQVEGTNFSTSSYSAVRNGDDNSGPWMVLGKSRGTTVGSNTIVQNNDSIGSISFQGNDGTEFVEGARIAAVSDGTPGANDMPGRLVFSTTADGAASPTERMRIDSSGNVGIGNSSPSYKLDITGSARLSTSTAGANVVVGNNLNSTLGTFGVAHNSTTVAISNNAGNYPISLQQGGVDRLYIDTSGNVGIGTTSPAYKLDINGQARVAGDLHISGGNIIDAIAQDLVLQSNTGYNLFFRTNGTNERMRIDSSGNVGIGTSSPTWKVSVKQSGNTSNASIGVSIQNSADDSWMGMGYDATSGTMRIISTYISTGAFKPLAFWTSDAERMRIDSSGNVLVGTTTTSLSSTVNGAIVYASGGIDAYRSGSTVALFNRNTNDGTIVSLRQADVEEGTISVSGTTVSYNGGHLSRWSQWQNETGKPNVYRGTILESTNDMCEWEKDGEPLPNEQATKTIVSTTVASKAVAGVFDRYDEDDETNPYDFYVAQSGDFVIRIAQGVTVQNGDLLESAGDGTAKPQADDICRSSTIAKVTSNYVSATYEDGSYCVPCILMIG